MLYAREILTIKMEKDAQNILLYYFATYLKARALMYLSILITC